MGRVKEQMINEMEMSHLTNQMADSGYQYDEWLQSKEFAEYLNG